MLLPTVIFATTTILALFLYWSQYRRYRKPLRDYNEASIRETQEKSYGLLHQAIRKAQTLMGAAELESLKMVSDSRYESRKLEKEYEKQFAAALTRLETNFSNEVLGAEKEFIQYLADLKVRSEQTQNLVSDYTQKRTVDLFERFEQNLAGFLTQTQQQSTEAVQLELKAARQLIDTYKVQQLALIDESIIAMLERTLSLVLEKKLSLEDNMDLVNEALEKAKAEKLII